MSSIPRNLCAERFCPCFGLPTSNTCGCLKTTEQLLLAERDTYEAALRKIVAINHACPEAYVREADSIALDALVRVEAA